MFLWLHYVNPHTPYAPPPPYDTAFLDAAARGGPALPVVADYHGGIPRQWAVAGQRRLGYYVAQYDGEIAAVDAERGTLRVLSGGRLDESPSWSPNGADIIYATREGGRGVLAIVSGDGRVQQRLAASAGEVREPAWSPFPR